MIELVTGVVLLVPSLVASRGSYVSYLIITQCTLSGANDFCSWTSQDPVRALDLTCSMLTSGNAAHCNNGAELVHRGIQTIGQEIR